jgi:membrane protein
MTMAETVDRSTRGTPAQWWQLVKGAGEAWIDDYAPSMGAALAYYTVFSLAPLLLMVISIAGLVFGQEAARGEIFGQLAGLMGADTAKAVEGVLASLNKPAHGITGTTLGVALLLIGATSVFGELQDALDRIWRAPVRERSAGWWNLLRTRLLSFGMILGIAFLLMVSLVLGAVISALGKWWGGVFGDWEVLAQVVNLLVGFLLTTVVFAMIYKLMPRVQVQWQDVLLGALVTSVLFTAGKFLIGLYIGKSGIASGYGAAGSLIVVFIWVYYSAQIFLMGAEFTWVYARVFGSMRHLVPDPVDEHAPDLPARNEDNTGATTLPPQAAALRPIVPPPPMQPPPISARRRLARPGDAALRKVGYGLAAGMALRYLVPRLLRRR